MKTYTEIKKDALSKLSGNWLDYILITIVGGILFQIATTIGLILLVIPGIIIAMLYGYALYNLSLATLDGEKPKLEMLFDFKDKIGRIVGTTLFTSFIPALAIIPGALIIGIWGVPIGFIPLFIGYIVTFYFGIRLQFALYIIRDSQLSTSEAISESFRISKDKFFYILFFRLSFIGWILLGILTFGILFFWLSPYMQMAHSNLYRYLSNYGNTDINTEEIETQETYI